MNNIIPIDVARGERLVRGLERLNKGYNPLRKSDAVDTAEGLQIVGQLCGAVRNAYRVYGARGVEEIVEKALVEAAIESGEQNMRR